ncbi:VOC family protein [Dactylosporangium roseum]|uniref:VOC family protein n=1 Tax=Dactylosporangium roseum TaxID=47989 RepID=A0ABY5ZB46_9ACTN|nr:VOC family protein [Dactylosporangium roseum]UWZ39264.1 VOC family protein [Dactylosporangium roseum]
MTSPIVHFDIHGGDEPGQHRFYAELFGWQVASQGPGYALVQTSENGLHGALVDADAPSVSIGIAVEDLAAALDRAVALGGTVKMPPTNNGWVTKAQVADPAGNPLTLIQR